MSKVFGYPEYDEKGEKILTTYDNEYKAMMMDIRVYRMKAGETRTFLREGEETAVLLLSGNITYKWNGNEAAATRKDFGAKLYKPEDAPWGYSCVGKFGNVAKRRVNTIFDHDISPESNMVLGEVLNDRGNWSGYLPHRHPQPETYFFKFDHPEGFGASFVGDQVFKSTDESFSAIPGGELHPQAVAPGYQMYTCWMIRHIDGNPWLQTDRCEDERYTWLHDAEF